MHVGLIEIRRQRTHAERERIPSPADRPCSKHAALQHVAGLRPGDDDRPEIGVRAGRKLLAERLAIGKRHPRARLPHCVHVFGHDTTSPDSTVSAAGRRGSITPELTVSGLDCKT